MTDRTPTTEAGRGLVTWADSQGRPVTAERIRDAILAIEDEARAPLVAALLRGHNESKPVTLKGHPQLGGTYCLADGADWPCATVREYGDALSRENRP